MLRRFVGLDAKLDEEHGCYGWVQKRFPEHGIKHLSSDRTAAEHKHSLPLQLLPCRRDPVHEPELRAEPPMKLWLLCAQRPASQVLQYRSSREGYCHHKSVHDGPMWGRLTVVIADRANLSRGTLAGAVTVIRMLCFPAFYHGPNQSGYRRELTGG